MAELNRAWVWLKWPRVGPVNATLSTKEIYGKGGAGDKTFTRRFSETGNEPTTWSECGFDLNAEELAEFLEDIESNGGQESDYVTHITSTHPSFQDSVLAMGMKPLLGPDSD